MPPKPAEKTEDPKPETEAKTDASKPAEKTSPEVKALAEKIFIQMCANNPRGYEPHHFAARACVMAESFIENTK
jgi:hypothetical protein